MARRATPTYSGFPGIFSSTTASPSLLATGPSGYLLELGQCIRFAAIDIEDLREARDLENPQDAHVIANQPQVAVSFPSALQAADQHAQSRAVQVLDGVQIDDQVHQAAIEQVHHLL